MPLYDKSLAHCTAVLPIKALYRVFTTCSTIMSIYGNGQQFASSFQINLLQFIKQAAVATVLSVPLFCLDQASFPQIAQCSPSSGFRQLQVFCYGWDRRPAGGLFPCSVRKIYVYRDCPVRQIHAVQVREFSHFIFLHLGWDRLVPPIIHLRC